MWGERDEGWCQPVIASLNNPLHLLSQPCVPAPCVSPTTTYHLPCLAHTPPERESSQTHSHTPHAQAFRDNHNREASPDKGCSSLQTLRLMLNIQLIKPGNFCLVQFGASHLVWIIFKNLAFCWACVVYALI